MSYYGLPNSLSSAYVFYEHIRVKFLDQQLRKETVNEWFGGHFRNVPLIITLGDAFLKVSLSFANKDGSYIPLHLGFLSDWLCNVAYIFVKPTFFILYWDIFKPFRWFRS